MIFEHAHRNHIAFLGKDRRLPLPLLRDAWGGFQNQRPPAGNDGAAPPLPELPVQYADYALWQRQWLQGERLATLLRYWQEQLAGVPELLNLPLDFSRPAQQNSVGAAWRFSLPSKLTNDLKILARQNEATLFMTLLAAFQVLLLRYANQTDIVVGIPIAGRQHPELEGLIGMFVNTLVMRADLSGNPSFRSLLQQVRNRALGAYAHQELPFERLVEALQPSRSLSHHPIFQAMFVLQNAPKSPFELLELQVDRLPVVGETAKFDLSFSLTETSTGLEGQLEYDTALFAPTTIERMASHYANLLEGVATNPDCPIEQLPLLTSTERHQSLVAWNHTNVDYPKDKCIHQLFEEQAAQTPDAVALIFGTETLTYRQLNERANQLAHYLQKLGINNEMVVGLCIERSSEAIIGMLGILKTGAAYLPLDPTYPQARLAWMLADTKTTLVLTQTHLQPHLLACLSTQSAAIQSTAILCLDGNWSVMAQQSRANPPYTASVQQLAYVMYTSGSTGHPKGIKTSHRNVVRLVQQANFVQLTADEVFLHYAPLTFDAATFEIWGSLLNGARLVVAPPQALSLVELGHVIRQQNVTTLWLTAGLFHLMVEERIEDLSGVRQLLTGGDVVSPFSAKRVLEQLPGCTLINGYGPTENTTFTCCYPMTFPAQVGSSVAIGRPIQNTQVYILDPHLQPVPIGIPGELHTSGDGLTDGYLNQPALTAEKFMTNPFGNGCLYKTGDRARYRADGTIEFLGRIDQQVKIRGFRVEPGEIEAVLASHPSLQQCVVIADSEPSGNKRLLAYVVAKTNEALASQQLRQYLADKLPEYMLPSFFVMLEKLPLTANGKVDRLALPAPEYTALSSKSQFVAAREPLERQLTQIWQTVLKRSPIGIHDSFFDLGGHSLLAVQLFERMAKATGKELPLSVLFQAPTITHLAEILRQHNWQPTWRSLVPVQPAGHKPPLFLAPPGGSTVLHFANITRHLPTDQPVYGLEYLGMDGKSKPHNCIEEMAAYYAPEIRKLQPNPPYLLAGICFGAHLMLEVAQQLMAQGQPVALLAVLDAGPPAHSPTWDYPKRFSAAHFQMLQDYWREESFLKWLHGHLTHRMNRLRRRIHPEKRHYVPVSIAHYRAQMRYRSAPYQGKICLIQSDEYARTKDKHSRWQSLAQGGFAYSMIPNSTHRTLLFQESYTKLLAEHLTLQIEQTLTQHSQ